MFEAMSAYKFNDQDGIYFVTFAVEEWVDVFTREEYKNMVLDSLWFCQTEKVLAVYAWVIHLQTIL